MASRGFDPAAKIVELLNGPGLTDDERLRGWRDYARHMIRLRRLPMRHQLKLLKPEVEEK